LPAVDRLTTDSASSYLKRSIDALFAEKPIGEFNFAFGMDDSGYISPENASRLAITVRQTGAVLLDIDTFDKALLNTNRAIVPSLISHLVDATHRTFDAIGPTEAYDLAMWTRFGDDPSAWYEEQRAEAAYTLKIEESQISEAMLRKFFRDFDIITPAAFRRFLGPHFSRKHLENKRLSLEACEVLIAGLNSKERHLASIFVNETRRLVAISKQLETRHRPDDDVLYQNDDWCNVRNPGLIVDRGGDSNRNGIVLELIDELYQQLMNGKEDFCCNYAFSISTDPADSERLRTTIDLFADASNAVAAIEAATHSYNEATG
jgi:hypothetical protein